MNDRQMLDRMERGWPGGRPFTECGNGTLPEHTLNARRWLPRIVAQHGISVINDAGAGDRKFTAGIAWPHPVILHAFDLVPRNGDVAALDIARYVMPPADAILCRAVLNHLDQVRVVSALQRFALSAKYLIATQYSGEYANPSSEWTRWDLRRWLGEPIDAVQDGSDRNELLALWSLR